MLRDEQPSSEQILILKKMTPEKRWQAAHDLYWTARRHKREFLRSLHPEWSESVLDSEVRRIFSCPNLISSSCSYGR